MLQMCNYMFSMVIHGSLLPPKRSWPSIFSCKGSPQNSCIGLNSQQCHLLKCLLDDFVEIFSATDENCKQTRLAQHFINISFAQLICLQPR